MRFGNTNVDKESATYSTISGGCVVMDKYGVQKFGIERVRLLRT
jgi:hypothetical protein